MSKCAAKRRRDGEPCGAQAITGLSVCRVHGGNSPQARAKSERVKLLAEVRQRWHGLDGAKPVSDPFVALQQIAGELVVFKDRLRVLIDDLEVWTGLDDKGMEYPRALVALYQLTLRDTINGLALIARLNIDERLATIEEARVSRIIRAIDAALTNAGIVGPAAEEARAVAGRHLRSVS